MDVLGGQDNSNASSTFGGPGGPEHWDNYDPNEPRYCICNQVSYGDMVACDNDDVSDFTSFFKWGFFLSTNLTGKIIRHQKSLCAFTNYY